MKNQDATSIPSRKALRWVFLDLCFGTLYKGVHFLERFFGVGALVLVTSVFTLIDLVKRRPHFPQFVRLHQAIDPKFWKGVSAKQHHYKMVRDWQECVMLSICYDRLCVPRWKNRFRIWGPLPETHPEWGQRPVIFAFMHTGGFGILRFWLRAQGYRVASLAGGLPLIVNNSYYDRIKMAGDSRYGLEDVPDVFSRYGALRESIRFLKPGNCLLMALDGGRMGDDGEKCDVDGMPILIRQGAVRIAAQTNAILIPVSVKRIGFCRFEIHFRAPVPDALIDKHNSVVASQHMVSDLWQDIKEDPTDLTWTTIEELVPSLKKARVSWP